VRRPAKDAGGRAFRVSENAARTLNTLTLTQQHAWHLALSGLRRGELCGLLWSDVDLGAETVTVTHNRVSVNGKAMDSQPKTDNSLRTLPLTPALTSALRRALAAQKAERWR
jgi:integrase